MGLQASAGQLTASMAMDRTGAFSSWWRVGGTRHCSGYSARRLRYLCRVRVTGHCLRQRIPGFCEVRLASICGWHRVQHGWRSLLAIQRQPPHA